MVFNITRIVIQQNVEEIKKKTVKTYYKHDLTASL